MSYVGLSELKTRLGIRDNSSDALLSSLLASGQSFIEGYCGREFDAGAASNRHFSAERVAKGPGGLSVIPPHEFLEVVGLLFPEAQGSNIIVNNGVALSGSGKAPWSRVALPRDTDLGRWTGAPFTMTAVWGYSRIVPAAVNEFLLEFCVSAFRKTLSRSTGEQFQQRNATIGEAVGIPFDALVLLSAYRRFA